MKHTFPFIYLQWAGDTCNGGTVAVVLRISYCSTANVPIISDIKPRAGEMGAAN